MRSLVPIPILRDTEQVLPASRAVLPGHQSDPRRALAPVLELLTTTVHFVQDNHSRGFRGVLRGLHYQLKQPQGKLVRLTSGRVLDVAVDLRRSSSTFGQHVGVELAVDNARQFWIPAGFAHAFLALSDSADFLYKAIDYYHPESERRFCGMIRKLE